MSISQIERHTNLVSKYIKLIGLFPQNTLLLNNVEYLKLLLEDRVNANSRTQIYPAKTLDLVWIFYHKALSMVREFLSRRFCFPKKGDHIDNILGMLTSIIETLQSSAHQVREIRDDVETSQMDDHEAMFLLSFYDVMCSINTFFEVHASDSEFSLALVEAHTEKRPVYGINLLGPKHLEMRTREPSDPIFLEHVLNTAELTACATLEFGFQLTYSELLKNILESSACNAYFSNLASQLSIIMIKMDDTLSTYHEFIQYTVSSDLESNVCHGVQLDVANRFSREHRLWKNCVELCATGDEVLNIFKSMKNLTEKYKNNRGTSADTHYENENGYSVDSRNHLEELIEMSNAGLEKIIKFVSMNNVIMKSMSTASSGNTMVRIEDSATEPPEINHELSGAELVDDFSGHVYKVAYENVCESLAPENNEDSAGPSKKFEVYELKEREDSDEDVSDDEDCLYFWETDRNTLKAAHSYVMTELKETLVDIKEKTLKQEKDAFAEKYGQRPMSPPPTKELKNYGNIGHSDVRKRKVIEWPKEIVTERTAKDNEEARRVFEELNAHHNFNIKHHLPALKPLDDEYVVGDDNDNASDTSSSSGNADDD